MSDFGRLQELARAAGIQINPPSVIGMALPVVSPAMATTADTLNCTPGQWNAEPTGYAYSWRHVGDPVEIGTGDTYRVALNDADTSVHCVVTATNSAGTASATSNAVPIASRIGP